jgi:hypothetical protein
LSSVAVVLLVSSRKLGCNRRGSDPALDDALLGFVRPTSSPVEAVSALVVSVESVTTGYLGSVRIQPPPQLHDGDLYLLTLERRTQAAHSPEMRCSRS